MEDKTNNKSFCVLPFIHIMVKPEGFTKPCCRFGREIKEFKDLDKYSIYDYDLNDIFNRPEYNKIRKKMLAGEKINGCYKCYLEEDSFGNSLRQISNRDYGNLLNENFRPVIKYLELGFGKFCNLRCRTCLPYIDNFKYYRIKPNDILKNYSDDKSKENNIKIRDNSLKKLQIIKLTGGEPMLHNKFIPFMSRLVKLGTDKNCKIILFTNSSYFPTPKIVNLLSKFKKVEVNLSIDGYGQKNNYIRYPSEWVKVKKAAVSWLKLSLVNQNITVHLNITISIYNVVYLDEIFEWWLSEIKNIKFSKPGIRFSFVFNPRYLSIVILPGNLKLIISNKIINLESKYSHNYNIIRNLEKIKQFLEYDNNKSNLKEFFKFTKDIDRLRNEKFEKTFPELNQLIKQFIV